MNRLMPVVLLLLIAASARADFVFVNEFEPIQTLYVNSTPYTIEVRDGYVVEDAAHQRQIPILIRYPAELLATPGTQLPLVLWSHGGGANVDGRQGSREWSEALVRAGYIVIHMSHVPRSAAAVSALYAEFGLTPAQGLDCFGYLQVDRPRDARAVLDALPQITASFPVLAGRIDPARIAMAGHSFGAYTARTMSGAVVDLCPPPAVAPAGFAFHRASFRDERPRAFLALSPQGPGRFGFFEVPGEHSWQDLGRPDFTATGAGDVTSGEVPADRVRPFQIMAPHDKYMLYIDSPNAIHATFNLSDPAQPQLEALIRASGIAFLDANVRGSARAAAWLHSPIVGEISGGVASMSRR